MKLSSIDRSFWKTNSQGAVMIIAAIQMIAMITRHEQVLNRCLSGDVMDLHRSTATATKE
jgi:hypothetical protein